MEYQFSQHVTREDYVNFMMNHLKMNMFKPMNIVFFSIGIGYLAIAPFITGTKDFTFTYIGLVLVLLFIGSIFLAKRNAGKRYDENAGKFDMSYIVDESGFSYKVGGQKVEKKWIDFYSAAETPDYLYIYVNKNSGSMLVKRDIDPAAIQFVKTQLRQHVSAKKLRLIADETTLSE